jgi:hypothetical protein
MDITLSIAMNITLATAGGSLLQVLRQIKLFDRAAGTATFR